MSEIKVMKDADIKFAKTLSEIEQWGHLRSDFERLCHLDPSGCFVAWEENERVGIVTSVTYQDHAFLGNLIVMKEKRSRGIGLMLMQHAIAHLDKRGVKTIELDGVFAAVSLYRRLGFRDKYLSLRFLRKATACPKDTAGAASACSEPPQSLALFDREKTGFNRGAFLKEIIKEHQDTTYCLTEGKLLAYAVTRERANGSIHIGPLVAENRMSSDSLLSMIIAREHQRILTIGVPEINRAAIEIVLRHGFEYCPPSLRMYRGLRIDYERHVYGIVSSDVG